MQMSAQPHAPAAESPAKETPEPTANISETLILCPGSECIAVKYFWDLAAYSSWCMLLVA